MPVCLLVGECVGLVATRLQVSEDEVRASEQRFRALVHHSSDVISVIDVDGSNYPMDSRFVLAAPPSLATQIVETVRQAAHLVQTRA